MSGALRNLVLLGLVVSGCSKSEQPAAPPVVEPVAERLAEAQPETPLAEIVSFDCGSSLPDKRRELVRAMKLGGPGGSAWNWDGGDLVCAVRVSLHCLAQPKVIVSAGDHEESAQVSQPSPDTLAARATFAPAVWRASLQTDAQPFATLRMRVRVEGSCGEGDSNAGRMIFASDEFTAGFASGE